jgi:hypothetical protein
MDDEPLVRAMPRRPLYALNGFISRIDLAVLTAVDEEGWCATRSAIAADVDSKEVRLAVVLVRRSPGGPEGLVRAGVLAHATDIGPETSGLPGLKSVAKALADGVAPGLARGIELAGYLNDDADPELRRTFVLVYRALVPPGTAAPEGQEWIAGKALAAGALEPLSVRVAGSVA